MQGVVSDVSGATVEVLGGLVTVDASGAAIVAEQDKIPLTISDVKVGSMIEVDGTMTGQVLHAASIRVHGLRLDGTIQGPIATVDPAGNHFSLLGLTIAVEPSTVFVGSNDVPPSPAGLITGKTVDAEVAAFQGQLIATRIAFADANAQSEANN